MASGPAEDNIESPSRKKGKELKIFLWCVVVASMLWLLTSLSENYNNTLRVRIHYLNIPHRKVFLRPLPDDFKVAVNAKGWDLLGYTLKGKAEDFYVDLSEFKDQKYILTRRLKVNIQQQISQKITINDIYPDTIFLSTTQAMVKKVPVKLNLKLEFPKDYQVGEKITYAPDSVVISGPISEIRQIKAVSTSETYISDITKHTTMNLPLINDHEKNISYSINTIKVDLPVYQLTESEVQVPIDVVNTGKRVKLVPARVSIIFQTTLNRYKTIDASSFKAVVDAGRVSGSQQPLKIQLISKPDFIYNVRLKPEYVNFVILQ